MERVMTPERIHQALLKGFPDDPDVEALRVESAESRSATVRLVYHDRMLRPGGTIAGPTLMKLADTAMYAALMSACDMVPLAVTTNLNIEFLHRPEAADLVARVELIRFGKRRATGVIQIFSADGVEPVALATASYHIASTSEK